ncbi:hypothetical protein EON66_01120 [archaeon]|nr:MAG: hypothetical protein EON66_01120 [archaeon]
MPRIHAHTCLRARPCAYSRNVSFARRTQACIVRSFIVLTRVHSMQLQLTVQGKGGVPSTVVQQDAAIFTETNAICSTTSVSVMAPGWSECAAYCPICKSWLGWKFERARDVDVAGSAKLHSAAAGAASVGQTANSPPPIGSTQHVIPYAVQEEAERLASLEGVCLQMNRGWWNYEWCHGSKIRQFHLEPDGRIHPDWSLGEYDKCVIFTLLAFAVCVPCVL